MIYEGLEGHPLLPPDAVGNVLEEQASIAERVLGLRGGSAVVFTDPDDVKDVLRALALQVTLQMEQDAEAFLASRVDRAGESISYRDGVAIHPTALALIAGLFADLPEETVETSAWPAIGPWR